MKSSPSVRKKTQLSATLREKSVPKKVVGRDLGKATSRLKKFSKRVTKSVLLSSPFQYSVKALGVGVIVASSLYGVYHFAGKTFANEVVISKSEIVSRVAKLTPVPEEPPYDVVRVEDGVNLQRQNSFYKDVKEGDYILIYKDMAIVYDLRSNAIMAMRTSSNGPEMAKSKEVVGATQMRTLKQEPR
jgi:hypothetical protein